MSVYGFRSSNVDSHMKLNGNPGEAKLIIPFTNPEIVGRFVFHCHVVKHEDKGMMMAVEVVR